MPWVQNPKIHVNVISDWSKSDWSESDFPLIIDTPTDHLLLPDKSQSFLNRPADPSLHTHSKYVRVGPLAVGEIEPLLTSVVVQVAKQQVAFVQKKVPSSVFLFPLHFSC